MIVVRRSFATVVLLLLTVAQLLVATPAQASHRCGGVATTIVGTPGNDRLIGTKQRDVIVGLGGDDVIVGRGATDLICAGEGDDVVVAGRGSDLVRGDAGADRIFGEFRTAERNSQVPSCNAQVGGGGYATSTSFASCGDTLVGGSGVDRIEGGPHKDFVIGRAGNDVLLGQRGDDRLVGNGGNDTMRGGTGWDVLEYSESPSGVTVDLAAGMAAGRGKDSLDSMEEVNGSDHADRLYGDAGENHLAGGEDGSNDAAPDLVVGRGGDDYLSGEGGNDELRGGRGRDFLNGGSGGKDHLDGGRNRDTCILGETLRRCEQTSVDEPEPA